MLSKKIREYKEANPNANVKEIASAVNTSKAYVYQVLSPKKKVKPKSTPVPTEGQKVLRKEIAELNEANNKWRSLNVFQEQRIKQLTSEVQKLKEHLVGHEYVISYLESRLGLNEANGATV